MSSVNPKETKVRVVSTNDTRDAQIAQSFESDVGVLLRENLDLLKSLAAANAKIAAANEEKAAALQKLAKTQQDLVKAENAQATYTGFSRLRMNASILHVLLAIAFIVRGGAATFAEDAAGTAFLCSAIGVVWLIVATTYIHHIADNE